MYEDVCYNFHEGIVSRIKLGISIENLQGHRVTRTVVLCSIHPIEIYVHTLTI